MATKNHSKSMSQPERAFWRDVYSRVLPAFAADPAHSTETAAIAASTAADKAVDLLRDRIMWKREP